MPGMRRNVTIRNLKNIERLSFDLPGAGVWLLTGENGSGKTSLLAVLHRIGEKNAFASHFRSSDSDRLDDFSGASIVYTVGNRSVIYQRRDVRWVPAPKRNANVLAAFNYPEVRLIGANASRISPREEDFVPARIRAVPREIISAANRIFDTDRFQRLRTVNVTRGRNPAYVFIEDRGHRRNYISERNFSVGELCILNLVKTAESAPANSLLLIDELELALHPSAQVRLYHYLKEKAEERNLTVIFSTHSVSLIKTAPRKSILFLAKEEGRGLSCVVGAYPSYVLGSLASIEERSADVVIYVEDSFAEAVAQPLLSAVLSAKLDDNAFAFPIYRTVPIGGYREVISFLVRHDALHRPGVESFALLDRDVLDEVVAGWRQEENYDQLAWLDRAGEKVKYLPFTAEVEVAELFRENRMELRDLLRASFHDGALHLDEGVVCRLEGLVGAERRAEAKRFVKVMIDFISRQTGRNRHEVERALGAIVAKRYFENHRDEAMRQYAPMFR